MSNQVDQATIDQFSSNVMHLSQQSSSRLFQFCRQETLNAESGFYDRIGKRTARRKAGRHSKVEYTDTPHSKRHVSMDDYYDADLVDKEDKLRTIMDIESEYAIAIGGAIGRQMDEVIIDGFLGSAYTGREKGTLTAVALPSTQKLAAHDGSGLTGVGLNVKTLRKVSSKFHEAEAVDENEMIVFVVAQQQVEDLLGETEVTSADFNTIRALVDGKVDTFLGFKFVRTQLLTFTSASTTYNKDDGTVGSGTGTITSGEGRRCIAFTESRAGLCANAGSVAGRMDIMPEYHYATQVYASLSLGFVRMEEEQVVEVICLEA